MAPKIFTVFGATGNQGGSIIKFILSNPTLSKTYQLRAITRDTSKPSATSLASQGVELATADLDNPSSLRSALTGSYAVFAVTNFWEHMDGARELQQGKNVADVCKELGVKHLVWSSLPHATKVSGGQLKHIPHFDKKAEVEEYVEGMKGEMWASYYMPAFFMSNLKTMINKGAENVAIWASVFDPTATAVPCIDIAADTGKWVAGILEKGADADGIRVQAVGNWASPQEMVDEMGKELGIDVKYTKIPEDVFSKFLPEAIAEELTENMLLIRDFSYYGKGAEKSQTESDEFLFLGAQVTTFREYVKKNSPWFT